MKFNFIHFSSRFQFLSPKSAPGGGGIPMFLRIEGAHLPAIATGFPQISGLTKGLQKHHYPVLLP